MTCDLNPYFKEDIWIDSLRWLQSNKELVLELCPLIDSNRLTEVLGNKDLRRKAYIIKALHYLGIDYFAPADSSLLPIHDNYFDAHVSFTVLEHIPREILVGIFYEAKRLVRPGGLLVHNIDFTDHFSHSDKHISAIHFLKFSELDFARLAGNRFMYMNRLRDEDFRDLWNQLSLVPYVSERKVSEHLLARLSSGRELPIHADFSAKSNEDIATTESWYAFVL